MIVKAFKVTTRDNKPTWIRLKWIGGLRFQVEWSGNNEKFAYLHSYFAGEDPGRHFLRLVRILRNGGANWVHAV